MFRKAGLIVVSFLLCALFVSPNGWSDPSEMPEVSLTRNQASPLVLSTHLSKNVYRYVERTVTYTVQVPYTIQIPYQVVQTYYTDQTECHLATVFQTVCTNHPVCGAVSVCQERRICQTVSRCTTRQFCTGFGPNRRCFSRPFCQRFPDCHIERNCHLENRCHDQRQCSSVPRVVNQCHDVRIPHTRVVTEYRSETRYRTETRQKIVTDAIFDHQWGIPVQISFPAESALENGEEETVLVSLQGSEQSPDVEVSVDSPIFSYKVAAKAIQGGTEQIHLALVPKYAPSDLDAKTIQNLALAKNAQGQYQVQFADSGAVARASTTYAIRVIDVQTGEVDFTQQLQASFGTKEVIVPVEPALDNQDDHVVELSVHRQGIVISGPVDFSLQRKELAQLNPAPYQDLNRVGQVILDVASDQVRFMDTAPVNPDVQTQYALALSVKDASGQVQAIGNVQLNSKDQTPTAQGELDAPIRIAPEALKLLLNKSSVVMASIAVTRTSPRLAAVSPIQIKKEAPVKITPDLASFADPAQVKNFSLQLDPKNPILSFVDATEKASGVSTLYDVKISYKLWGFLWKLKLGETQVARSSLQAGPGGKLMLPLARFLDVQKLLKKKGNLYVDVTVTRTDDSIAGVFPIRFQEKTQKL